MRYVGTEGSNLGTVRPQRMPPIRAYHLEVRPCCGKSETELRIFCRDLFPLILSSISAPPQNQFTWTMYAYAGRTAVLQRMLVQQGDADRTIHEQHSLFLISFICRTGDFPMQGSNRLLLTLYLVVMSLILIIIVLGASGVGE